MTGPAAVFWLVVANAVVLALNGYGYILAEPPSGAFAGVFVHVALLAQLWSAALVLGLLLALLLRLAGPRVTCLCASVLFAALQLAVYVDSKVFALYRFHVNGLVLGFLTTRAGWESMQVSQAEVIRAVGGIALLLAAEMLVWALAARAVVRASALRAGRRAWLLLAGCVALLAGADHLAYAVADVTDAIDIVGSARVVPLYQPFTVKRLVHRLTGVQLTRPARVAPKQTGGPLRYPRAPLRFRTLDRPPNIVWLVVESWRRDVFTADNTPESWRLARDAQVFTGHVSGGNSTRYGIFSMFYGLPGSYWDTLIRARVGPVLVRRLKELGYAFRILSSTPLEYAEFRRTAFADVPEDVNDALPGPSIADKDRQLVDELDAFTARAGARPFFAFLFFDSPHAPYDFPPEFARYQPHAGLFMYGDVSPARRELLFNRYRNAIAYTDHLVGQAVANLAARGVLDHTVVLVTGDHGEECYEHGYWGHGGAFTPEQIRVPLLLLVPGLPAGVHERLTGHQDLAATFLELLGVENPPADYSTGHSLLGDAADAYEVTCGWGSCALIDGGGTVVFGTEAYNATRIEVRDPDYRPVADRNAALRERAPQLVALMSEMSAFLR